MHPYPSDYNVNIRSSSEIGKVDVEKDEEILLPNTSEFCKNDSTVNLRAIANESAPLVRNNGSTPSFL